MNDQKKPRTEPAIAGVQFPRDEADDQRPVSEKPAEVGEHKQQENSRAGIASCFRIQSITESRR